MRALSTGGNIGLSFLTVRELARALAEGDHIYALIRATAVNQDGRTAGISLPNQAAQEANIVDALRLAHIAPDSVQYVEAHGTGTAVGDPIEVKALGEAYGRDELRTQPLLIGSVKASIGHLEAASGVAGVIKAALAVHHRTIPPQVGLDTLNPAIPFSELNVEVVTDTTPFPHTRAQPSQPSTASAMAGPMPMSSCRAA
jgi:acyl transferase domain-containing protein